MQTYKLCPKGRWSILVILDVSHTEETLFFHYRHRKTYILE